ncbi:hypothetical protein KUL42_21880 [Alteromonas sp. KUL42]|uniref:hypothetical protein n=1 Tax=Alteromonas sp. KUL42 TaxID=2480797 RepID=UPI0010FFB5EA|nr:hypothetical protein [Alteromonas sp. KUL42]GEA07427.1 hypothetical protein KUL42_21880 [Alteromonas sp. KUL42]
MNKDSITEETKKVNENQLEKLVWRKPELLVYDVSTKTQNNFNGGGSDGKFFS